MAEVEAFLRVFHLSELVRIICYNLEQFSYLDYEMVFEFALTLDISEWNLRICPVCNSSLKIPLESHITLSPQVYNFWSFNYDRMCECEFASVSVTVFT